MLRFRPISNARAAGSYYGKSDGGYYLDSSDLKREVGGEGARALGLDGKPDYEEFKRLLEGLDPKTGEQLTAKLVEGRLAGWDVTASVPKGVTLAIENGDDRVHDALWQSGREAMADLEAEIVTRKRKGGAQEDRPTGNLIWYGFEHPETRPLRQDGMPDPDRHIHFVIPNITFDSVEQEFKAIKFRPIMDMRKYFDRRFDARLASKLTDLGYEIETKYKPDKRGGRSYFSWDIKGMPESAVKKFSRRGAEVEALADALGIESATAKDKLGATSRQHKRDDLTLEDYRAYWRDRMTPAEELAIACVIEAARDGTNPKPENTVSKGVEYAIAHLFERRSVLDWHELEIAAMERCLGGAHPDAILSEAQRQGVLFKNGEVTTKEVLAEESRIIEYAREGRGSCRPLGDQHSLDEQTLAALSDEQRALVSHVIGSHDRIVLVVGDAGTGKTRSVKAAFEAIHSPVEMLAPTADASRGVLRDEGFSQADTIASFLGSEKRQEAVRGGVIWIDEAGLLPIRDLSKLVEIAKEQGARLILQGDPKQHASVVRHGDMLNVLQQYAGLKVGRLSEIWRQKDRGYKAVVSDIAAGREEKAFDRLAALGWVKQVKDDAPLIEDYFEALHTKKRGQEDRDRVLIIAPTHAHGEAITAGLRTKLKEQGKLGPEDRIVERLVPLNWTEAERADLARFDGSETLVFHRNSGSFKAGDRIAVRDWKPGQHYRSPAHFAVYAKGTLALAPGDTIRITAGGKSLDGHRLDNGSLYRVAGFDERDNIVLDNGWTIANTGGFIDHGYVSTSFAAQGKTVDRVLVAMGSASMPAINREQFYVSLSRGRDSARVFSDLPKADLKSAIHRSDPRRSATELMGTNPAGKPPSRIRRLIDRVKRTYEQLRDRTAGAISPAKEPERELNYGR